MPHGIGHLLACIGDVTGFMQDDMGIEYLRQWQKIRTRAAPAFFQLGMVLFIELGSPPSNAGWQRGVEGSSVNTFTGRN